MSTHISTQKDRVLANSNTKVELVAKIRELEEKNLKLNQDVAYT